MTDVFSSQKRSEIMSKIRSKNTAAEKIVFQYLRRNKIYFQKHYKRVIGTPDIALPRKKKAVFIDSDFWHGKTIEQVRQKRKQDDYWVKKIERNMRRDIEVRDKLRADSWQVLVVWENDIKRKSSREDTMTIIKNFLES